MEYFLRYIFVCVNTAIYMSFWGEMKQFYYVCKVGVHCTYLFKVFFSINGPQTAIDLNNGEGFCIQKKMGTLKKQIIQNMSSLMRFPRDEVKNIFFVKSILSRIFFMKNDWLNNIFKLIFNRDLFLFSNFLGRHRHLHHSFKEILFFREINFTKKCVCACRVKMQ